MTRIKRAFDKTFPFMVSASFLLLLGLFLEAIFQVSKPSYFSRLSIPAQFKLICATFMILWVPVIIAWGLLFVFALILSRWERSIQALFLGYWFVLSLMFFSMALFHADTFVYTIAGWSVYLQSHINNLILLFLLVDISLIIVLRKARSLSDLLLTHKKAFTAAFSIVFTISLFFFVEKSFADQHVNVFEDQRSTKGDLPNIILFSADGLDARHLGVYGYQKDIESNLEKLREFTIYKRAYCNGGITTISTTSILTGKSPLTTGVMTGFEILQGKDSIQHLPNILARLGYYTVDLNDGIYSSMSARNLRLGFYLENGKEMRFEKRLRFLKDIPFIYSLEFYLILDVFQRYKNKLFYMAGLSAESALLRSPILLKTDSSRSLNEDQELINKAKKVIREVDQPLFIRLHLTTSHPNIFGRGHFNWKKSDRSFMFYSAEKKEKISDLYDQSVRTIDKYFGEIVQSLKDNNKFENALIIFHTDHGQKHFFDTAADFIKYPLPLIVRMPGQKEKIVFEEPVQYLDIAPSILAFLGHPIPEWMEGDIIWGQSMNDLDLPDRWLISTVPHTSFITTNYFALIGDDKYYIYSTVEVPGKLYDISGDPYDFRLISSPELTQEYHDILRVELKAKGMEIEEKFWN